MSVFSGSIRPDPASEPTTIGELVDLDPALGVQNTASHTRSELADVSLPGGLRGGQAGHMASILAEGFVETDRHIYRDAGGAPILAVCRFEKPGDKTFRPLRQNGLHPNGQPRFDMSMPAGPSPLYNLADLHARPDAPVLLVEGERTANAAAARFPAVIAMTWPGGAMGVGKVDLDPLRGRHVLLWPDNDKPGRDAVTKLARRLHGSCASVGMVHIPAAYPEKWDLADSDPADLAGDDAPEQLLARATPFQDDAAPVPELRVSDYPESRSGDETEIPRAFDALRYLADNAHRDFSTHPDRFAMFCAAKNTFGEAGFAPAAALAIEAGDDHDEDEYRQRWDSMAEKPDGGRLTIATFFKEARDAGWVDPTKDRASDRSVDPATADDGSAGGGGSGGGRADPASVVLEQAEMAGDELWLDQFGTPHVSMAFEDSDGVARRVHMKVGGKRHKGALSLRYWKANPKKVLAAEQEKRATQIFEHIAREGGTTYRAENRSAFHEGCIFVDLGRFDGKAARVDGDGWSIVEDVPVRFVRGKRGELPLPERYGTIDHFQRHLNLSDGGIVRMVAFCVGVFAPLTSYPLLLIEGLHGSAKSTVGDMTVMLVDPPHSPKAGRTSMPRGEQNLLVHARGVLVPFFDNVSDISELEADALCRLATGGSVSTRQLYTDDEETQINAVRPIVLTCIGTPTGRGDMLDRCLRVTALPVEKYQTEEMVYRAFEADRPKMLGFVLDALSASLRNKPSVEAKVAAGEIKLARMADFAVYAEGAAAHLGMAPGEFSESLVGEQIAMQVEGVLGDPVGEAIGRYFSVDRHRKVLEGSATEVLDALSEIMRADSRDPKALPASNKLRGALRRNERGLASLGISFEIEEAAKGIRNKKATYRIRKTEGFEAVAEPLPF